MKQRRIFITGGASGLGEALSERYAAAQWAVCFGDIHKKRGLALEKAMLQRGHTVKFLPCDVCSESELQKALDWMVTEWGGVDTVVNNAGVAVAGPFHDTPLSDWQWIIDINLLGVVRGCQIFLRQFQKQGFGQIINIASAAGLIHLPKMGPYNATKAAVVALSETIRLEYPQFKVSVVCPTFFKTRLSESLRTTDSSLTDDMRHLVGESKVAPSFIAGEIYREAEKNRFLILPDNDARRGRFAKSFLPQSIYLKVVELGYQRKKSQLI